MSDLPSSDEERLFCKTPASCHSERSEESAVPIRGEEMQILRFAQNDRRSAAVPPNITSFPRKRESIGPTMGPRFRGDDDDFRCLGWATGLWKLLRMAATGVCQRTAAASCLSLAYQSPSEVPSLRRPDVSRQRRQRIEQCPFHHPSKAQSSLEVSDRRAWQWPSGPRF